MSNWNDFQREEGIKPGNYRVEIVGVENATTKMTGLPMLVITLRPNGSDIKIKHYIVKNDYYNRNMTNFFDSFNIDEGDFEFLGWIGATGAARLDEDENGYLKVGRFISQDKAEDLPQWEGGTPERQTVTEFAEVNDDDLPI